MQILFITPQLPYPPHQGTTLRNYNLIRYLAQRHTVDLLTFHHKNNNTAAPADSPLHQLCRRIHTVAEPMRSTRQRIVDTLRSPLPDMALRLESAEMRQLVHAWALHPDTGAKYDVVQCEGIEVAQYGLMIAQTLKDREAHNNGEAPPVLVFDDHNCEYLLQKRNALTDLRIPGRWPAAGYSLVQWQKLRRYEKRICDTFHATVAVSPADRESLHAISQNASIDVISNGIDLAEYDSAKYDLGGYKETVPKLEQTRQAPLVLFIGKMDYRPNIDAALWFGRYAWPLIRAEEPAARFQIVGMNPHPRLDELRDRPGIEITGAVESVQPYLQRATAYVIPLRVGGGTRFKALEAMAARKAIVSTRLGIEGIPVQHEQELLLADDAATFAAATLRLIRDTSLAQELGQRAHAFVAERYQWSQIAPLFEQVYAAQGRRIEP